MSPATEQAFDEYRRQRAAELFEIAALLLEKDLISNPSPIQLAAGECQRRGYRTAGKDQPDGGRKFWGYEIANLRVNLEKQRHLRPATAVMEETGTLSVTVQEYLPENEAEVGKSYDLLRQVCVDFHIDAEQQVGGAVEKLRSAWHIDTHLFSDTRSRSAHPRFHYQVGGFKLDDVNTEIRGVLVPEVPRMACAPLDAILAVDFVLSHYCGVGWNRLREQEPRYGRLRKPPMQRYWSPYFRTLADGIDGLNKLPKGGAAAILLPSICM